MKNTLLLLCACLLSACQVDRETQIQELTEQMTLEEKVGMLHGQTMFTSSGVDRLNIAPIKYADGPFGIREELEPHSWAPLHLNTDSATFFPTGSALAATWSEEMARLYGKGMAQEARTRGKDMIL
ncbi:MAG: glycosyl hydrolase, partial [Bacteroidales bacterium]|nr:glycosyl hydrolase [Bacteroidales bacterium]